MEILNSFIDFDQSNPLQKVFEWGTDLVTYDSGTEQRNQIRMTPKRHWYLNWSILPLANRNKLIELFNRGAGKYRTFRYEDSDDYTGTCSFTQTKYDITDVDISAETFTIVGNYANKFTAGKKFEVRGSTGNDSNWEVESSENSGETTIITVTGNITNATADGRILPKDFQLYIEYYPDEDESWTEDKKNIQADSITGTKGDTAIVETTHFTLNDTTGIVRFGNNLAPESIDIKEANAVANTFIVDGDITGSFAVDDKFVVTGSTLNDDTYTITGINYDGGDGETTIEVASVADGTDDGVINQYMEFTFNYYYKVRFNFDSHKDIHIYPEIYEAENLEIIEVK
jgi:hypothetical protein